MKQWRLERKLKQSLRCITPAERKRTKKIKKQIPVGYVFASFLLIVSLFLFKPSFHWNELQDFSPQIRTLSIPLEEKECEVWKDEKNQYDCYRQGESLFIIGSDGTTTIEIKNTPLEASPENKKSYLMGDVYLYEKDPWYQAKWEYDGRSIVVTIKGSKTALVQKVLEIKKENLT